MKLSRVIVCGLWVAGSISSVAMADMAVKHTGSVWAEGVTVEGGWYDVDKSSTDQRDNMMCYAASAANLIAWWQNGEYGSQLTTSAPTKLNDIWTTYLDYSKNNASGGDPLAAINWWISGVYVPVNEEESQRSIFNPLPADSEKITLSVFDGFYYEQYGLNKDSLQEFLSVTTEYTDSYFGDLLSGGAGVSLWLKSDVGNLSHAITLWGVDYTADGKLSKLWITDSDDGNTGILSIDVVTAENGKIYFDENGDIGDYDLYPIMGISGIHVFGVSGIHTEASANWQLVPEPSTATLSILALVALTSRRRRK